MMPNPTSMPCKTLDTYEALSRQTIINLDQLSCRWEVNIFVGGTIQESKHFDVLNSAQAYFDNKVSEDCDKDLSPEEREEIYGE